MVNFYFLIIKLSLAFFISFLITLYVIPLFISMAKRLSILDIPDGKVKMHKSPTPYLGGVAVYVGFIASLALFAPFENKIILLLIGATFLLFLGLIDDMIRLKPYQKFFGQMIATFCFLKCGLYVKESFFLNNVWNIPFSALWIITIINAFNLIDVMDGLATITATMATISFFLLSLSFQQYTLAILLICFLGPLFAFFIYNKPPAHIYLGDAGSLFIGGFLATFPFLFNWGIYTYTGFLTPLIIFAIPLFEISSLVIIRSYKRIPFYNASPDHFSLYLQRWGWHKNQILLFVTLLSILFLMVAYLFVFNKINIISMLLMLLSIIFFIIISIGKNIVVKQI